MNTMTLSPEMTWRADGGVRRMLLLDAIVCACTGLALTLGAGLLDDAVGLSLPLLRWVGVFLLVYAAVVAVAGTRDRVSRPVVEAVIGANVLWVLASLVSLVTAWLTPTALGAVLVVGQAIIVALIAAGQWSALRRGGVTV